MWPLLLAGLASSAISYGANWYQQQNNQRLWEKNIEVQKNLYRGYADYLRSQGRSLNPDKAWNKYLSSIASNQNSIDNSNASLISGAVNTGLYDVGRLYKEF